MRKYDYTKGPEKLLTPNIVSLLGNIRERKGRQDLFIEAEPDILTSLVEVAKVQSAVSSNRIEGIYTSDQRVKDLLEKKAEPRNRSEEEIAGYRDVLAIIHESYDYIPINSNVILQLHKNLYSFSGSQFGGNYKNMDNIIAEVSAGGEKSVRFRPVPAFETPAAIESLCSSFNEAMNQQIYDPLILIAMFILDFLCIHPFNDGNGRMSRLLTLLLLYKSGLIVGKYISIEMLIEESKDTYYESLQASSYGWHEAENSYEPFVSYQLGVILKAYNEFEDRVDHLKYRKLTKAERVEALINKSLTPISKKELLELAPDISRVTVERALVDLQEQGKIKKVGQGRSTKYIQQ